MTGSGNVIVHGGLYTAISLINEYCEQLDGIAGVRAIPMDFLLADALIHRKTLPKQPQCNRGLRLSRFFIHFVPKNQSLPYDGIALRSSF